MMQQDSYYYYIKGDDFLNKRKIDLAIAYFRKSLELSEHFKTYFKLYECYKMLNQFEKANNYLKLAYLLNKKNDKTALEYAKVLIDNGSVSEAKIILLDILKRNPSYKKATIEYNRLK